jgi:hypothetical protein
MQVQLLLLTAPLPPAHLIQSLIIRIIFGEENSACAFMACTETTSCFNCYTERSEATVAQVLLSPIWQQQSVRLWLSLISTAHWSKTQHYNTVSTYTFQCHQLFCNSDLFQYKNTTTVSCYWLTHSLQIVHYWSLPEPSHSFHNFTRYFFIIILILSSHPCLCLPSSPYIWHYLTKNFCASHYHFVYFMSHQSYSNMTQILRW